jgi:uncharacterized protein (TIGR03437 family)
LVGTVPSSQSTANVNVNIGRRSGGFYFKGVLDEIRVYNRALTQDEIQLDKNTPLTAAPAASSIMSPLSSAMPPLTQESSYADVVHETSLNEAVSSEASQLAIRNTADVSSEAFCSPGSWASIFGAGFTRNSPVAANGIPLPSSLGGIVVKVNGSTVPLSFVSESQINFQCPILDPDSVITVAVEAEGRILAKLQSQMYVVTPSLFTIDSLRESQGAVVVADSGELAMPLLEGVSTRPVKKGEHISIFANGLGLLDEDIALGVPAPLDRLVQLRNRVRAFIGGVEVEPTFAGLAPGGIGLYQINAAVPDGASVGPAVPVRIHIVLGDGTVVTSNTVVIAIEDPQPVH